MSLRRPEVDLMTLVLICIFVIWICIHINTSVIRSTSGCLNDIFQYIVLRQLIQVALRFRPLSAMFHHDGTSMFKIKLYWAAHECITPWQRSVGVTAVRRNQSESELTPTQFPQHWTSVSPQSFERSIKQTYHLFASWLSHFHALK